jgi:FtsX-like permease family
VGGVGIANVMVISVLERRSEIGLRRALGATRRHISVQFLSESLLLSGLGGALGAALGAAITIGYAWYQGWSIVMSPWTLAGGSSRPWSSAPWPVCIRRRGRRGCRQPRRFGPCDARGSDHRPISWEERGRVQHPFPPGLLQERGPPGYGSRPSRVTALQRWSNLGWRLTTPRLRWVQRQDRSDVGSRSSQSARR